MRPPLSCWLALVVGGTVVSPAAESDPAGGVAIVCHVGLTSDKVPDLSSMDAWKKAFIREGMSDRDKGMAVWSSIVAFKQQDQPPLEYVTGDGGDVP